MVHLGILAMIVEVLRSFVTVLCDYAIAPPAHYVVEGNVLGM